MTRAAVLIASLALALVAASADAQTAVDCGATSTALVTIDHGDVTVEVYWAEQDTSGAPTVATSWGLWLDGVLAAFSMTRIGPAPIAGCAIYQGATVIAKGNHALAVQVTTMDGSATSGGLSLKITGKPPKPPKVNAVR